MVMMISPVIIFSYQIFKTNLQLSPVVVVQIKVVHTFRKIHHLIPKKLLNNSIYLISIMKMRNAHKIIPLLMSGAGHV